MIVLMNLAHKNVSYYVRKIQNVFFKYIAGSVTINSNITFAVLTIIRRSLKFKKLLQKTETTKLFSWI